MQKYEKKNMASRVLYFFLSGWDETGCRRECVWLFQCVIIYYSTVKSYTSTALVGILSPSPTTPNPASEER